MLDRSHQAETVPRQVAHRRDDNDDNDDATHSIENNIVTFEWSSESRYPQHEDTLGSFVYRQALIILPSCVTPINPSEEGFAEESSAILYNLGLAYHLYGLENESHFLHTALTFYKFALEINETRMHDLFALAVLNNLGRIHHEIFDFEKSLRAFHASS